MSRTPVRKLIRRVERLESWYKEACVAEHEEEYALEQAQAHLAATEEAQRILQGLAQTVQQYAHSQISGVVTKCLETVFGERYEFKILFEQKRGRTEARLVLLQGDHIMDPLGSVGGGVVDLAAFALRITSIVLARPAARKLLVLDEPFKFVSEDYRGQVRLLLEQLSRETGVQIVMVTHLPELRSGKVVELE